MENGFHLTSQTIFTIIGFVLTAVGGIWAFARTFAKIELKPDQKEVNKIVEEKLAQCLDSVNVKLTKMEDELNELKSFKLERIERLHNVELTVQRIEINLETVCDHLKLLYKK